MEWTAGARKVAAPAEEGGAGGAASVSVTAGATQPDNKPDQQAGSRLCRHSHRHRRRPLLSSLFTAAKCLLLLLHLLLQEKSHTSSMAELALELPSTFHSVFTQICGFHRRLLPVFGLENTFQRLCSLCVFLPSASSAATDRLLGGTFLSCAVLVQKNNTTETKITRANDNLCSLHRHLCLCDIATTSL